jgi:hypothetical protein
MIRNVAPDGSAKVTIATESTQTQSPGVWPNRPARTLMMQLICYGLRRRRKKPISEVSYVSFTKDSGIQNLNFLKAGFLF